VRSKTIERSGAIIAKRRMWVPAIVWMKAAKNVLWMLPVSRSALPRQASKIGTLGRQARCQTKRWLTARSSLDLDRTG
jgi:hypothetical protein